MLVEACLLIEAKAAEKILPIHKAQLLSYMKLLDVPVGLLINFHAAFVEMDQLKLVREVVVEPVRPVPFHDGVFIFGRRLTLRAKQQRSSETNSDNNQPDEDEGFFHDV